MEDRKWEDMSTDCLVNIFGRLDIESMLLCVPVVCKPWYRAVHQNPLCWQKLDFRAIGSQLKRSQLMKIVANHSQRCAVSHVLIEICTTGDLYCLSEACPALNTLVLPTYICCDSVDMILSFIGKWKNLEILSLKSSYYCTVALIKHISICLPNFIGLHLEGGCISEDKVSTIVSLLPKLMYLTINQATLGKGNLLLILKGCKELVFLDVPNCIGFDEDDEEILKLSSVIKHFQCDGSTSRDPLSKKRKSIMGS